MLVTIWWSDQIPSWTSLASLSLLLAQSERDREDKYRHGQDRARFLWRRIFRRKIISDHFNIPAHKIEFSTKCHICGHPDHGKPRLVNYPNRHFSLSQARDLTAIALDNNEIGLDVVDLRSDFSYVAELALTPLEERALPTSRMARNKALGLLWARKEAILKASGNGLAIEPSTIHVLGSGFSSDSFLFHGNFELNGIDIWWITSFSIDNHRIGAIACKYPYHTELRKFCLNN